MKMPELASTNLAIAAQQLKAEITFKKIKELLEPLGIDVLVLKGPHLGATVYNSPKERIYGDLDLLVRPDSFQMVVDTLLANGFLPHAYDQFSQEVQDDFKHWEFNSPWGVLVEVHRWLSGHDRYPLDYDGLFSRAKKFVFGETEARGLATEDLLLHLCLHMGTSYFKVIERKHIRDIALLAGKHEVDWSIFMNRVKNAGAGAIAYYALSSARLQHHANVPDQVMNRLRPGSIRRWWIGKFIDSSKYPIYRASSHGIDKAKNCLIIPFMDMPRQWGKFIWRSIRNRMKGFFVGES